MIIYGLTAALTILWIISAIKLQDLIEEHIKLERNVSRAIAELNAKNLSFEEEFNNVKQDLNLLYKRTNKLRKVKANAK